MREYEWLKGVVMDQYYLLEGGYCYKEMGEFKLNCKCFKAVGPMASKKEAIEYAKLSSKERVLYVDDVECEKAREPHFTALTGKEITDSIFHDTYIIDIELRTKDCLLIKEEVQQESNFLNFESLEYGDEFILDPRYVPREMQLVVFRKYQRADGLPIGAAVCSDLIKHFSSEQLVVRVFARNVNKLR